MTVRQLLRRVWLAAFVCGSTTLAGFAQSPDTVPLPPLPGGAPAVPPQSDALPPLPGVVPTTPVVPVPAVPPPAASVPTPPAALPMMSPMPTAAPELPPMALPGDPPKTPAVKPPGTSPTASIKPVVPVAASSTPASKSSADVKMGKPALEGATAYAMALTEAKIAYSKVADYSGHVIHQDRVHGKLTAEQTAEIRVKAKPSSVALKYVAPSTLMGLEVISVAGRHAGKVRFKPAGSFSPGGFMSVDPTDVRAVAHTRHPVTEFGIGSMIERLEKQVTVEHRLRNAVQVSVSEYTYAGRAVTRYEVFTDRPHALRYAYRTVVYVDKETRLPIRMEAYDQPTAGSPTGDLIESYSYVNLKFNQGIGDNAFAK